jgi:hypothetical protein
MRCQCGIEKRFRVSDLIAGTKKCLSCSSKERAAKMSPEIRLELAIKGSQAALKVNKQKLESDPLRAQFGYEQLELVSQIGVGAKGRCVNKNNAAYPNYGGRGIEFRFPTIRTFVEWVLQNLGPRPSSAHSIDRIDNNAHYEPGNLRWATNTEQARNKRMHKRTAQGERIRSLQAQRPDLTYETIRIWIKQGAADDEILQRVKYARTSI